MGREREKERERERERERETDLQIFLRNIIERFWSLKSIER